MVKTSPWTLSWCELPMIQSVRYSTSLLRNFISCLNVRSSRLSIIASTSWHTFVLICIAWIVESRWRTYLPIAHTWLNNDFSVYYFNLKQHWRCSHGHSYRMNFYLYAIHGVILYILQNDMDDRSKLLLNYIRIMTRCKFMSQRVKDVTS